MEVEVKLLRVEGFGCVGLQQALHVALQVVRLFAHSGLCRAVQRSPSFKAKVQLLDGETIGKSHFLQRTTPCYSMLVRENSKVFQSYRGHAQI